MLSTCALAARDFSGMRGVGAYPGQAEIVDLAIANASSFNTADCSGPYTAPLLAIELSKSSLSFCRPRVLVKRTVKAPLKMGVEKPRTHPARTLMVCDG